MNTLVRYIQVCALCIVSTLPSLGGGTAHAEGVLAQLYAAKPPPGTSFVRIANPLNTTLRVKIDSGAEQLLQGDKVASTYAIVKGGAPFDIKINGKKLPSMQVAPGTFTTLVAQADGKQIHFLALDDSGSGQDALKAELRFYNLAAACDAGHLKVAASGPQIFADVKMNSVMSRSINPVQAQLTGGCGGAMSAPVSMPALQPGDHYSFFLTGSASSPVLKGQISATDPYKP